MSGCQEMGLPAKRENGYYLFDKVKVVDGQVRDQSRRMGNSRKLLDASVKQTCLGDFTIIEDLASSGGWISDAQRNLITMNSDNTTISAQDATLPCKRSSRTSGPWPVSVGGGISGAPKPRSRSVTLGWRSNSTATL